MTLRLTTAGIAALASAEYTGLNAIRITHIAIGDGSGPGGAADDGRTALRSERDRSAATGTPAANGRISFRGDFMPAAAYNITEAGVFATAGGNTILLAYWTKGGAKLGVAVASADLVIAATIAFAESAAQVAVTVSPTLTVGRPPAEATTEVFGTTRYTTDTEAKAGRAGNRAVTAKSMRAAAGKTAASLLGSVPTDGTIYQLKGNADGELVVEEREQDAVTAAEIAALKAKTVAASTATAGITRYTTDTEAKDGLLGNRAVTAKAMRAAASATVASLLGAVPEDGTKYALQGGVNGVLTLVRLAIVAFAAGGTSTVAIPATDPYPGGVYGSSVGSGQDISIGGVSSWTIPADGDYTVAFTMRRTTYVNAGSISGQLYRERNGVIAFLPQADIWTTGAMGGSALFCGTLEAGDIITVRHAHAGAGSAAYRDSTGRTINPPFDRVGRERYKCPAIAIIRHDT